MDKKPDNIFIELASICKLKECLLKTQNIIPVINDMDKEPLWDGHLYLYKLAQGIKNNAMIGRIPVQIKGTCSGSIKRSRVSRSIKIEDLQQYKKDGGVMFFVVVMGKNFRDFAIYYKSLLPFDILRLLQVTQKTATIHLEKFPVDNSDKIVTILKDFVKHREKQMSTAEKGLEIRDMLHNGKSLEDLKIKCFRFDTSAEIFGDMRNIIPSYIYAEYESGVQIPVEAIIFEEISTEQIRRVVVGDDIYDCNIEFKNSIEGQCFIIENSITILNPRNGALTKISFRLSNDLDERIVALKIIKSLYKYMNLTITGAFSGKCESIDEIDVLDITNRLEYYEKIKAALNKLKINKKFDMKSITPKESYALSSIVCSLVDGSPIDDSIKFNSFIGIVGIGNLKMLVKIDEKEQGKRYIKPVQTKDLEGYITFEDGTENQYPISICTLFNKEDFVTIDNLSYEHIYSSVIKCGYCYETSEKINSMVLEIIAAYDMCSNNKLLELAVDILTWLIAHDSQVIYKINYYQCIKRTRQLSEADIKELIMLKTDAKDNATKFGINVLLENRMEADFSWNQLTDEEQAWIKKYPIYTLYDRMI